MTRVVMAGSGGVAEGLVRQIAESREVELVQVWARDPLRGKMLASSVGASWTNVPEELALGSVDAPVDMYILAVSDGAVSELSESLPFPADSVVAHTAGCVALEELSPRIAHRAVLYPLQSFTRGRTITDFRRTPFFVEGSTPHALEVVREVAGALSDDVTEMNSERRAHIHLAGAFANNFSNAMLSVAQILATEAGSSFESLKPIVSETFAKALDMPSPRDAQTGVAQRGDVATQAKHLAMLAADHPELRELYEQTSKIIWEISKRP